MDGDPPKECRRDCPSCGGTRLYATDAASSGGRYAPSYLPGLGGFLRRARVEVVVVCADCGLIRLFASAEARERLPDSPWWRPL